ncbi:hypothetical protein NGRA_0249 [Nosema granulosis]|uniref:C2H2-type domain-containing protein n=1 Tax=Nosema granulosis TaxID=83296 RepID=A0A9P6L0B9_9MICR|nr:hypothetical protein NGRA_0249 [Nosema granulosis]
MKCSACQMELVDSPREHYKSEIHRINVHRQIYNAPPISLEEFNSKGNSSDVSVEIYNSEKIDLSSSEHEENLKHSTKTPKTEKCLFCPEEESLDHYLEHTLTPKQAQYLLCLTCYVCNEGFTTKTSLKDHLENDKHRTAVLQNDSLVLENGKILTNKPKSSINELPAVRNERRNSGQIIHLENTPKKEDDKNKEDKNKLKTSLRMNLQKHFRPDWMQ